MKINIRKLFDGSSSLRDVIVTIAGKQYSVGLLDARERRALAYELQRASRDLLEGVTVNV